MKKILTLAIVLFGLTGTAFANPEYESAATYFAQDRARAEQPTKAVKGGKRSRAVVQSAAPSGNLVARASKYIGANARQLGLPPTLWCADFMNMLVGGSNRSAFSYARRGAPAQHGCVNCVAVTKRRGGGHVGIVTGYDKRGNPVLISGNHSRRVGVGTYARHQVIAYRYV